MHTSYNYAPHTCTHSAATNTVHARQVASLKACLSPRVKGSGVDLRCQGTFVASATRQQTERDKLIEAPHPQDGHGATAARATPPHAQKHVPGARESGRANFASRNRGPQRGASGQDAVGFVVTNSTTASPGLGELFVPVGAVSVWSSCTELTM